MDPSYSSPYDSKRKMRKVFHQSKYRVHKCSSYKYEKSLSQDLGVLGSQNSRKLACLHIYLDLTNVIHGQLYIEVYK